MKTENIYPPAYNNKRQVIDCAAHLLNLNPEDCIAELKMVIGWNGLKYTTSTDWHITSPKGKCILPPCASLQYPMYIPARCGYIQCEGGLSQHTAEVLFPSQKDKVFFREGNYPKFEFNPGEWIEIAFNEQSIIILSDCAVKVEYFGGCRHLTIENGPDTVYARFQNGKLTKL